MLSVVVLDLTAESRNKIVDQIYSFIRADIPDIELVPRVTIKPLSRQELKFHAAPNIIILGQQILQEDLGNVGAIRKLLPDTAIFAKLNDRMATLATIEQLARLGVDDTLSDSISAADFLRKIILVARKKKSAKAGQLVLVDSGKGGTGVTTVAAGVAEALSLQGKRAVILDCDFETQDLSRFMQLRPFINENLQVLLDQTRPVTQEFVEQCLVPAWCNEKAGLWCMPAVAESEGLYDPHSSYARTIISILEILDASFDYVVVDSGCARGAILKTLYRVADHVIFLVNNDPASLYASVDRVTRMRGFMAPTATLSVVENCPSRHGLTNRLLREEFSNAAKLESTEWCAVSIPFCKVGQRWPGSGMAIFTQSSRPLQEAMEHLLRRIGALPAASQSVPGKALNVLARAVAGFLAPPRSERHEVTRSLPSPQPNEVPLKQLAFTPPTQAAEGPPPFVRQAAISGSEPRLYVARPATSSEFERPTAPPRQSSQCAAINATQSLPVSAHVDANAAETIVAHVDVRRLVSGVKIS